MEVHHHAHTARKKWTHYFWEFLMLFLAVFCGFLAENQREHFIENKRAKEYIHSLYADLKADTTFIGSYVKYLDNTINQLDTLTDLISRERFNEEERTLYRLAFKNRRVLYFQYNNRTFDQLRSSGNLRLLRNRQFADSLAEYDNMIHEVVKKQEERYLEATANHTALQWEILDSRAYKLEKHSTINVQIDTTVNLTFSKDDILKLKRLNNLYFEKKLIIPPYRIMMAELLQKANVLINLVKTEYHLK